MLTSWERTCNGTKRTEMKFSAVRPAFLSPSLHPNQMVIECNGKAYRLSLGYGSWEHLPVVYWPLFRGKLTWPDCHAKETPAYCPGGRHCRPGFCRLGSHSQAPGNWCWNSHTACQGHWAGPGKRWWPGAWPRAGKHWALLTCAHLASDMRMKHLIRGTVLLCVEDTFCSH